MKNLLYLIFFLLPFCLHGQSISIVTSDTTICSGTTVAFVATASGTSAPHYQWTINSNIVGTDNSMYLTDSLNNWDTVRCNLTDASGTVLAISDSFIIHVRYIPDAGTITGPDTVCQGATITLTTSVPGGTWLASNFNATVNNGVVSGIRAGHYFECHSDTTQNDFFYIVTNICGTDTASKTVVIHPKPYAGFYLGMPYDPVYSLCIGAGAVINGGVGACGVMYSTTGNVNVNWWGGVTGAHPGTDYIYCVAENYCGTHTYGQTVKINAPPDSAQIISSAASLCSGYADTLRADVSGFQTHWYGNGTVSISDPYNPVTPISGGKTGIDTITLSVSNQCGIKYDKIIVTVNPIPAISELQPEICKGYVGMIRSRTPGGTWSSSQPNIAIASDNWISGLSAGTTTVSYTMPTGCFTSANIKITDCPEVIQLFPDPVKNELVIHLLAIGYFTDFDIVNNIGQQVTSGILFGAYVFVNVSNLTPGVYCLTVRGPGGRARQQFVKD